MTSKLKCIASLFFTQTPSKHESKYDSLPFYLKRQLVASSTVLSDGLASESPAIMCAIVVHLRNTTTSTIAFPQF